MQRHRDPVVGAAEPLLQQAALLAEQDGEIASQRMLLGESCSMLAQRRLVALLLGGQLLGIGTLGHQLKGWQQQVAGTALQGTAHPLGIEVAQVEMRPTAGGPVGGQVREAAPNHTSAFPNWVSIDSMSRPMLPLSLLLLYR